MPFTVHVTELHNILALLGYLQETRIVLIQVSCVITDLSNEALFLRMLIKGGGCMDPECTESS